MKIRTGFVSNSSSSSFVCDICDEEYSGMDMSPRDVDGGTCVNGHTYCDCIGTQEGSEEELKKFVIEQLKEYIEEAESNPKGYCAEHLEDYRNTLKAVEAGTADLTELAEDYGDGEVLACQCPICSFKAFSRSELARYLENRTGITTGSVYAILKVKNKRKKKLHDAEYIAYVLKEKGLKEKELLKEVKSTFKDWVEFIESL